MAATTPRLSHGSNNARQRQMLAPSDSSPARPSFTAPATPSSGVSRCSAATPFSPTSAMRFGTCHKTIVTTSSQSHMVALRRCSGRANLLVHEAFLAVACGRNFAVLNRYTVALRLHYMWPALLDWPHIRLGQNAFVHLHINM